MGSDASLRSRHSQHGLDDQSRIRGDVRRPSRSSAEDGMESRTVFELHKLD